MRSEKKLFTDLKFCTNFGKSKSKSKSKIIPKMLNEMNVENVENVENVVLKIKQNVPKKKKEKRKKEKKTKKGQYSNKHNFGVTNVDKIVTMIEKDPVKESKIKKGLYMILIKSGQKLGDIVDYTLKALISMTIKYVGPMVILALLYKYHEPITKKLGLNLLNPLKKQKNKSN